MALRPPVLSLLLLAAALGVYVWAMIPRLLTEAAWGPICSGHPAGVLHCPACYAAAALAAGAILSAIHPLSAAARRARARV